MGERADDNFLAFFRRYARSGTHAATAALLTLFGLLSSVAEHWAFVGVGVAIYVLPPAYLYATQDRSAADETSADLQVSGNDGADPTESEFESESEAGRDGPVPESETGGREGAVDAADGSTTAASTNASLDDSAGWQWRPRSSPTDADIADVTAAADGAYAVGAGGVLLARRDGAWETVLADGAGGDGNDFTAVDATTDGRAVWAVGDGGAVTRYDVDDGRHVDFSAPNDQTSTWTGVAVAGPTGAETAYLANGSGVVLRGVVVDGEVPWGEGTKPGSGSSIADLDFPAPERGLVCDTSGGVFETLDGDAFERVGIDDPGGTLTAVSAGDETGEGVTDANGDGDSGSPGPTVAADDGSLHRRDRAGWTSDRPTDAALFGLASGRGEQIAVGEGGTILVDSGDGWEPESVPVDATLRGAARLADGTAVAVGDEGTVIERRPGRNGGG